MLIYLSGLLLPLELGLAASELESRAVLPAFSTIRTFLELVESGLTYIFGLYILPARYFFMEYASEAELRFMKVCFNAHFYVHFWPVYTARTLFFYGICK